jgi:hypothetical protein
MYVYLSTSEYDDERTLTKFVQVYYFYSYGTAAWLGMISSSSISRILN